PSEVCWGFVNGWRHQRNYPTPATQQTPALPSCSPTFPTLEGECSQTGYNDPSSIAQPFSSRTAMTDNPPPARTPADAEGSEPLLPTTESPSTVLRGVRQPDDPTTAETLPRPFGRYELRKRLGKGGMGTVYLAWDGKLDRVVALKLPHAEILESPGAVERFR